MTIEIPGTFTTLNEYINATRTNKYIGAKIKREETELVRLHCLRLKKIEKPVLVHIEWHLKNKRKDPDNIASAKKVILDGLVSAGVLENDGWSQIAGFQDEFFVGEEKVVIHLIEMDD